MSAHLSAIESGDDSTLAAQTEFVNAAAARLTAADNTQKEMLGLTSGLSVYFACKSGREHTRVLSALRDFKPMLQEGVKKAQVAAAPVVPVESPAKNTRSRTKTGGLGARTAFGQRSVNNVTAGPGVGGLAGMEGLGAAVAARAANRRSALAGLP